MEAKEILPNDPTDKQVYQYAFAILDIVGKLENEVNKPIDIFNGVFTGRLLSIHVYAEQIVDLINSKEGETTS